MSVIPIYVEKGDFIEFTLKRTREMRLALFLTVQMDENIRELIFFDKYPLFESLKS